MRLCFIADLGSPTARGWIGHFEAIGHEVFVLSTGAVDSRDAGPRVRVLGSGSGGAPPRRSAKLPDPRTLYGRVVLAANSNLGHARRLLRYRAEVQDCISSIKPDLLHCLRIPIEGELGLLSGFRPLVVSVWGNDLTLHARASLLHRCLTPRTLRAADGIFADCQADIGRAAEITRDAGKRTAVVPGGGGLRREDLEGLRAPELIRKELGIPHGAPVLVNPRGIRSYVRHDTVFAAMASLVRVEPSAVLVAVGLKNWPVARRAVKRLGIERNTRLTEPLGRRAVLALLSAATASVSISDHDGTPNSLLEAMALGALPICGALPSTREWISSGVNGILVDQGSPEALADAMARAIRDRDLAARAARENRRIVEERASSPKCMAAAERAYEELSAVR